jgi:hypothetical protein
MYISSLIISYRYNLDADELKLLRLQLERLEADGYKWKHPFTQCIMQILLHNLRYGYVISLDLQLVVRNERLRSPIYVVYSYAIGCVFHFPFSNSRVVQTIVLPAILPNENGIWLLFRQSDPRDLRLCDYLKKSRSDEQDGLASEVSVNPIQAFTDIVNMCANPQL